jgi:hypothetical protein
VPQAALLDAKFSYPFGRRDAMGANQRAAYQSIYQNTLGGPAASPIPLLTWDTCACNRGAVETFLEGNRSGRRRRRDGDDPGDGPSTRGGTPEEQRAKRQRLAPQTLSSLVSA